MYIFQFGTAVERLDGTRLATVRRVIVDVDTMQVRGITVEEYRLDGQEVRVPIGVVQSADDDAVLIAVDDEQFNTFDLWAVDRNIAPPPDAEDIASDQVTEPDVPDVLPVGFTTGVESIAFTPLVQETDSVSPGEIAVNRETMVYATDGEAGRLQQVRVDEQSERAVGLVLEQGAVFQQSMAVDAAAIKTITPESIVLTVDSGQLVGELPE